MRFKGRKWTLVSVLLAVLAAPALLRAQVALTTVQDTVYSADGETAQGTVLVSWSAFTTAAGNSVAAGTTSAVIGAGGALSIALAPNAGATPMGSYYTAVFHLSDGTTSRQYWVIPAPTAGGAPVKLAAIQNDVLPTSMAMQTVSKSYVDTAIAKAVTGGAGDSGSTDYVQKAGDIMTGPLVLAGDPVSPLQAADKRYVDTNVAQFASGLSTKVSTVATATQTVAQPAGTQLEVNSLNGVLDASGYVNGNGNNGFANALASSNCTTGCEVRASRTYPGTEAVPAGSIPSGGHVIDARGGAVNEFFVNPMGAGAGGSVASSLNVVANEPAEHFAATHPGTPGANSFVMELTQSAPVGGNNLLPGSNEMVPYGKSTYGVLGLSGVYNTQGQHVQFNNVVNCYGVGDCLAGGQFITSSGGYRDEADEGSHPFDLQVQEDTRVFQGTCGSGCTTGATALTVNATSAAGTQGDGRFLIDKNPSKVISSGAIVGGGGSIFAVVNFSGTNFPVSVFLTLAQAANSQGGNMAPGNVTLAIAGTAVQSGFSTSTAALPAQTGVACVADTSWSGVFPNFETAPYSVVDASHIQLTLNKVHYAGATVAVGGLCGYGLEQSVDTVNGIRQVFPVVGSASATSLYYAAANTTIVGYSSNVNTSGYLNASMPVASAVRNGNVVTLTLAQGMPYDLNGLSLAVSGVADSSFNGTFVVSTTSGTSLTYSETGANATSSGGTVGILTGGFNLYPMAEVLGVANPATAAVDGSMTLAPNTVAWAAGDPVEEPHYHQQLVAADTEVITQFMPKPIQYSSAGKEYEGIVGPGTRGWQVTNAAPVTEYLGGGGTHQPPDAAYVASGVWRNTFDMEAGQESLLRVHCNLFGCNHWNSRYAVLALDSHQGQDFLFYDPVANAATWNMAGIQYTFAPTGFTANNINASNVSSSSIQTGSNGNAQIAPGGTSGYSNFTLNGNNSDTQRLGFIGGGTGDPNLYLDVPAGGSFRFRIGSILATGSLSSAGLSVPGVTATTLSSGTASNTDIAGTLVLGAGATSSAAYSFGGTHASAPVCIVQPQNATPAVAQALSGYVPQVTTTGLTVSVGTAPAANVTFGYQCIARN